MGSEPVDQTAEDSSSSGLSLDGEQLEALICILDRLSQGVLTKDAAAAAVAASFPEMKPEDIQTMVDGVLPAKVVPEEEEPSLGN
jgi:hypothetical protein